MDYDEENRRQQKRTIKIMAGIVIGIVLLIVLFAPFVLINAGNRGVVLNWGAVSDNILTEGIHFRVPAKQRIIEIDVQTQKVEITALSFSKDIQEVDTAIALNYHVDPNAANKLYQEVGEDYISRVIDPAVQEAVKASTAKFTAQELIDKRPELKSAIKTGLTEQLKNNNIIVDEFSIVNFKFSPQFTRAIEEKQVAQQQALKADNDLQRIQKEADQRVAQAEAEAKAIKIQAEAVTQQGGKDYVQLQAIERWNGEVPRFMIPNGTVPFLDLNAITQTDGE